MADGSSVPKKVMVQRGHRACMAGRSRDSHGMSPNDPGIEHWTHGYDIAALKDNYAEHANRLIALAQKEARQIREAEFFNQRTQEILALVTERPRSKRDLADAFGITEGSVQRYINRLLETGQVIKWRQPYSTRSSAGATMIFYTVSIEQAELIIDAAIRPVRTTWAANIPAMFAPMAHLFGRAA